MAITAKADSFTCLMSVGRCSKGLPCFAVFRISVLFARQAELSLLQNFIYICTTHHCKVTEIPALKGTKCFIQSEEGNQTLSSLIINIDVYLLPAEVRLPGGNSKCLFLLVFGITVRSSIKTGYCVFEVQPFLLVHCQVFFLLQGQKFCRSTYLMLMTYLK